jgi:DNA polymerase III epsilon subunit-like protein
MRLIAAQLAEPDTAVPVTIPAFHPRIVKHQPQILGIDIENKPLWYGGGDYVYDNVVCLSSKWVGEPGVLTFWLDWRLPDTDLLETLEPLRAQIEQADVLLGHNFRHDWKGIKSVFNHLSQPFLPDKPVVDTMRCIPGGMPRSLEWLVAKFSLGEKPHVPAMTWVAALERYEPWAIEKVKERNRLDVELTEKLYWREKQLGWLP